MNNNDVNENKVVYLRLDDIIPNRFQPREVFDETGLEELADSIREHGIIQPVIVRQIGDKYELIAGERRSKASAIAGLTTIPAIIRNMDDKESAKVSLLENLQRKNLSAIEEARTYKRILELDNMTQEELAKTMGKSQPLIANKLRLLSLPEEVQDALIKNQISERHARSLLNVKDKKQQLFFLDRIKNERLTVRELDSEIKKMNEPKQENNVDVSSASGGPSNNPFQEPFHMTSNQEYRNNFNSMGLNDYQSQVNNSMFNNIPTNYQSINDKFNNLPDISSNVSSSSTNKIDYSDFGQEDSNTSPFVNQPSNLENQQDSYLSNPVNQPTPSTPFTSLGSMFDGQPNSIQMDNSNHDTNLDNKNVFVSHIKEEETKQQGNQFLPNFDDFSASEGSSQGGFLNTPTDFYSFDSMKENGVQDFNNNQTLPKDNFGFESYTNFSNLNSGSDQMNANYNPVSPAVDFSTLQGSYNENQGSLFNQPLNLVDVPKQEYAPTSDSYDFNPSPLNEAENEMNETPVYQENTEVESSVPFDNPLDDPYENILFAKPVPIQQEGSKEEKKESTEEVELIGEKGIVETTKQEENLPSTKEKEYISLDPVQTIFDTRGAVLELKKTTDRIKQNHIKIDTEEIDFDDCYQITIKIKKE